jgi:hypothetical protein
MKYAVELYRYPECYEIVYSTDSLHAAKCVTTRRRKTTNADAILIRVDGGEDFDFYRVDVLKRFDFKNPNPTTITAPVLRIPGDFYRLTFPPSAASAIPESAD